MEELKAKELTAQTGRQLLDNGLVARTWGNISCRVDNEYCVITPSGLDYNTMQSEDIVLLDIISGKWSGRHKPSGEKGVHMAAYTAFKNVGFVIHTHQTFATAIGISGFEDIDITEEEINKLGGIDLAGYGLSGTKKLTKAVANKLNKGNHTVLMAHHGALICGKDREEAMNRALLLEQICRRNIKNFDESGTKSAAQQAARLGQNIYAQIDDMAQMIGGIIPVVNDTQEEIKRALQKYNAILIKDRDIQVRADDKDDREALETLVQKACITHLHTLNDEHNTRLGKIDVMLMNYVYRKKYSKQKNGEKDNGVQ